MTQRSDILSRESDIRKWVKLRKPKSYICQQLHCRPSTLETYLNKFGIIYAGNQGGKGSTFGHKNPVSFYLKKDTSVSSHWLKLRLYEEGLKEPVCEECDISEWNKKALSFHLDHINGNRFDNRLKNLRILCPNCHSQTPTYAAKKRV